MPTPTDPVAQPVDTEGSPPEVLELFSLHRDQLRRTIAFRLDGRVRARVDFDDVLQEAFLEISRRAVEFTRQSQVSFLVWARRITLQVLVDLQRKHLGAAKRDVSREVRPEGLPRSAASGLAIQLLADSTSPSGVAIRHEAADAVRRALEQMSNIDREVLVLRHFEDMSNRDIADVLNLTPAGASRRYLRALQRLRSALLDLDSSA